MWNAYVDHKGRRKKRERESQAKCTGIEEELEKALPRGVYKNLKDGRQGKLP